MQADPNYPHGLTTRRKPKNQAIRTLKMSNDEDLVNLEIAEIFSENFADQTNTELESASAPQLRRGFRDTVQDGCRASILESSMSLRLLSPKEI